MKNMKRVLLTLCMTACFFALTACSKKEVEVKPLDPGIAQQITQVSESMVKLITSVDMNEIDEQIAYLEEEEDYAISTALSAWKNVAEETGALGEIVDVSADKEKDGYSCDVTAQFEKRSVLFTVYMTKNGELTSISVVPEYTTGEKLEKAGLNTLMGMGTVFCVLIFISLLIACFKFIHQWEEGMKDKTAAATPAPAPAAVPAAEAEEELADDLELVAVITAAIAASTGASADSLVVRSIKRAGASKWKRA